MASNKQLQLNAYIQNRVTTNRASIERFGRDNSCFNPRGDTKHVRLWQETGYPEEITPEMFRFTYERDPAAAAGINRTLDKCWESWPEIIEYGEDDKDESAWELLARRIFRKAWPFIKDADRKNLVNRYSCLIMQIADGRAWNEPVDTSKTRRTKDKAIIRYLPVWEEQMSVSSWVTDETDDNYGQPAMWQYNQSVVGEQTEGQPERSLDIHPDRVILLAEGSFDGALTSGVPLLRAGFNSLIDMAKITGSAAEGFLKNASRQLNVNYTQDNVTPLSLAQQMGTTLDDLGDMLNEDVGRLNEAIDAAMFTMGADVKVLSVTPADPSPAWTVAANQFCASIQKPFTVIFGQQTGRLASDEDKYDHASTAKQRREGFLNHVIGNIVERFIRFGIMEEKEYEIKWDDLLAPSDSDKADLMSKLATANKSLYDAGQPMLFTVDEIRAAGGYEAIDDGEVQAFMQMMIEQQKAAQQQSQPEEDTDAPVED